MPVIYIWFIILVLCLAAEIATLGLVTIWFALGALVALIVSALNGPMWLQIVLFVVVSVVALLGARKMALEKFNTKVTQTNVHSVIGKKVIVLQKVSNIQAMGKVSLEGMEWTARTLTDGIELEEGSVAVIREVRGVKLIVEKVEAQ
ncbi:MAG: NfeD family protein [Lachnospiraceae bacterium]